LHTLAAVLRTRQTDLASTGCGKANKNAIAPRAGHTIRGGATDWREATHTLPDAFSNGTVLDAWLTTASHFGLPPGDSFFGVPQFFRLGAASAEGFRPPQIKQKAAPWRA
jgi:hypothetical protein